MEGFKFRYQDEPIVYTATDTGLSWEVSFENENGDIRKIYYSYETVTKCIEKNMWIKIEDEDSPDNSNSEMHIWDVFKELSKNPDKEFRSNTQCGDYLIAGAIRRSGITDVIFSRYNKEGIRALEEQERITSFLRLGSVWNEVELSVTLEEVAEKFGVKVSSLKIVK